MNVIEKNEGKKIPYAVRGSKITFDDEVMYNLEKYEREDPNHIDLCRDKYGNLVSGVIPGVAEVYVAQIDIPAREFIETPPEVVEGEEQSGGMNSAGGGSREPVPFDMNKCTLTLWATE